MRRPSCWVAFCGVSALGCGAPIVTIDVPLDGQPSAILFVQHGSELKIHAFDEDTRDDLAVVQTIDPWDGDPITLWVARFDASLASLGLRAGAIEPSVEGRLLAPTDVVHRFLEDSDDGVWAEGQLPADLASLRFGEHCRTLVPRDRWSLDGVILSVASNLDGTAVVLTRHESESKLYRVGVDLTPIDVEIEGRADAMVAGPDGALWLAARLGDATTLYRGSVDEGFLPTPPAWTSTITAQLPAAFSGAGSSLHFITHDGMVYRRTDAEWRFEGGIDTNWVRRLIATSAGGAAFATDGLRIHEVSEGIVVPEATAIDPSLEAGDDFISVIAAVDGVGVVAGTDAGYVLLRHDATRRWSVILDPILVERDVRILMPFEGGVLVGGNYGVAQQYYPGIGFCESQLTFGSPLRGAAPIEGGVAVVGVDGATHFVAVWDVQ